MSQGDYFPFRAEWVSGGGEVRLGMQFVPIPFQYFIGFRRDRVSVGDADRFPFRAVSLGVRVVGDLVLE